MYDIIIVGAGPSGMTAALYGRRANKKILVLEALTPGGQIINANKIDNYPGLPGINGVDFATNNPSTFITSLLLSSIPVNLSSPNNFVMVEL